MTGVDDLAFSLDWLSGAAAKPTDTLTVCELGHLVVNRRTHYAPTRLSEDLHALWMRWVDHPEGGPQ